MIARELKASWWKKKIFKMRLIYCL
jgi:hypothetical protein